MGYTTEFTGHFTIEPKLDMAQVEYINKFSRTRRVKRDPVRASGLDDPIREAVELPIGRDGGYFVGGRGYAGQDGDASVLDGNSPPNGQPGLWCQWVASKDGTKLMWDGNEKFYHYEEWLEYIIEHFMSPWKKRLNGRVRWVGEDIEDTGIIEVIDDGAEIKISTLR